MHALWLVNASAGSQVSGLFFGLSEFSRGDIELRAKPQKALQISVVAPTGSDRFRLTVPIRGVLRLAA